MGRTRGKDKGMSRELVGKHEEKGQAFEVRNGFVCKEYGEELGKFDGKLD